MRIFGTNPQKSFLNDAPITITVVTYARDIVTSI